MSQLCYSCKQPALKCPIAAAMDLSCKSVTVRLGRTVGPREHVAYADTHANATFVPRANQDISVEK